MSTSWRVTRIDPDTWTPTDALHGISSVSVSKRDNRDGSSPLMESGSIEVDGEICEGYYRIEALEPGKPVQPIATLIFVPDDSDFSHRRWTGSANARSVLVPASDRKFDQGEYVERGDDGARWVADKLRESLKAPVVVAGSVTLDRNYVFDLNSSHLEGCWKLLASIGWCLQISETGIVTVMPVPTVPSATYDSATVRPKIRRKLPIDDVPNVVRVWYRGDVAEAVNDDPESPTSVRRRHGRRIEHVESSPTLVNGETLDDYAQRRLDEKGDIYERYEIERDWIAGALPYSCIYMQLAEASIQGSCSVMSQDIECGHGISVSETVGRRANG